MKRWVAVWCVGSVAFCGAALHADPARNVRKNGEGRSGVLPVRDANEAEEFAVSSPEEVAERAESKLVNTLETAFEVSALASTPPNDLCGNATPINGQGTFPFDNTLANKDGGSHTACSDPLDPVGTIDHDVWYCWTAPCSGPVLLQTCNQTAVDTKVAVYDGCTCPATSANLLGCNDDGCGTGSFLQSRRTFQAVMGQSYLLRIGTYPGDIGDPSTPIDDLPPAPGGVGTFSLTCLVPPCQQSGASCQEIKANAGSLSNRTHSQVADNFTPTLTGMITEVCWWGSYGSDIPPTADTFRIRYFANTGQNLPGAQIGSTLQQPTNLMVSGPVEIVVPGAGFPIFEYSATHAAVSVTAGQTYWIEITNVVAGDNWYWQQGFGEDRRSLQDGSKPGQINDPINGYTAGDQINNDMAFCAGVPIVQPPPTDPCLTATNSCCTASASERGCSDRTCCEAVCTCDPFCCNIAWDINCATVGLDPNCGAQVICPGLCAGCPDGAITFTNPEDCTVDAGQPHGLLSATPAEGIQQLTFLGPSGADNESCWTATAPNSVQNIVDHGDGSFTLMLAQPLTALSTTQLTYLSDTNVAQSAQFIAHPGNVDADGNTGTGDVTALVECCLKGNCMPPYGAYSCDINRSGTVTAEDVARLLDLLNGGNAFGLWNFSGLPANTCP